MLKVMWSDITHFNERDSSCNVEQWLSLDPHTGNVALAENVHFSSPPEIPVRHAEAGTSYCVMSAWNFLRVCKHSHLCVTLSRGLIKVLFVRVWSARLTVSQHCKSVIHRGHENNGNGKKSKERCIAWGMQQYWCSGGLSMHLFPKP